MDQINWGILQELQKNARIPFAEIGRKVGLTSPAVAERVKKITFQWKIAAWKL